MKTFAVGFFFVALFYCHQLSQALDETTRKLLEECVLNNTVADADAKIILDGKLDEMDFKNFSSNMRCFIQCSYRKMGAIDANNKPNNNALLKFMQNRFEAYKDKVKPALIKCASVKDPNPCDAIYKYDSCVRDILLPNKTG